MCALSAVSAWAQAAPYCAAGQAVDWQLVLVPLSQQLGDTMGQPLECPHPSGDSDDIVQQTSTGLAIVRANTGAPTFTDGSTRWALIGSEVVSWTDAGLDPPAAQTACARQPVRGFGLVFQTKPEASQLVGCPTLGEVAERVVVQRFEHGWMLWQARRDTAPPTIYVLFDDSLKYLRFDDTYVPGVEPLNTSGTPPAGLVQPTGGFGKIWREASAPSVRDRLGWATATESGGDGAVETFQHGLMVYTPDPREIFVLAASTADRPAQVAQVWRAYVDTFTD
jgi:hypothetical protein